MATAEIEWMERTAMRRDEKFGLYLLANDAVIDWTDAFLRSLRALNPRLSGLSISLLMTGALRSADWRGIMDASHFHFPSSAMTRSAQAFTRTARLESTCFA